ncbi:MAG: hypothetical protein K8S23_16040 [Candidatus Cloacimonetes bacterium]|nr:hypothetical protein [Candidatus Cloacimonadota bacterium]
MKNIIIFIMLIFFIGNLFSVASDESFIDIHGFVSQGYLQSSHNNFITSTQDGTFKFNEIGLNFATDLSEKLHVGFQMLARDLDKEGFTPVNLDWAYGDYRWNDFLGLRMGLIKVPYGLYNEIRDIDFLRTNILMPQSIYNEGWRESVSSIEGGGIYGVIPLVGFGTMNYQVYSGLVKLPEDGRMSKSVTLSIFEQDSQNIVEKQSNVANIQWETPLDGLKLGFSWLDLDFDSSGINAYSRKAKEMGLTPNLETIENEWDSEVYTGFMEFSWGNLTLSAEYTEYNYDVEFIYHVPYNHPQAGAMYVPQTFEPFTAMGYYGSLTYRFTNWFEANSYYAEYYFDKDDKEGKRFSDAGLEDYRGWLKDATFALRFDIDEYWTLKLEGHKMYGVAFTFGDENLEEDGTSAYEEDWYLFGAKVTFNF